MVFLAHDRSAPAEEVVLPKSQIAVVKGTFNTDTLNGELVLVEAKNWNPEDYGYEPVEI